MIVAPIALTAYSPAWLQQYSRERSSLAVIFPPSDFRIEHIGSTSVPGLAAKPIIDILIGAPALTEIEARIPAMEARGYGYVPEHEAVLPQRRYFVKPVMRPRNFHVHAVEIDGTFWMEHLLFRDALRALPDLAEEYTLLKRELAARFRNDPDAYTDAKAPFIRSVIARVATQTHQ